MRSRNQGIQHRREKGIHRMIVKRSPRMADLQQARAMSRNFKREYMASRRTVSKEKKKMMQTPSLG